MMIGTFPPQQVKDMRAQATMEKIILLVEAVIFKSLIYVGFTDVLKLQENVCGI